MSVHKTQRSLIERIFANPSQLALFMRVDGIDVIFADTYEANKRIKFSKGTYIQTVPAKTTRAEAKAIAAEAFNRLENTINQQEVA